MMVGEGGRGGSDILINRQLRSDDRVAPLGEARRSSAQLDAASQWAGKSLLFQTDSLLIDIFSSPNCPEQTFRPCARSFAGIDSRSADFYQGAIYRTI